MRGLPSLEITSRETIFLILNYSIMGAMWRQSLYERFLTSGAIIP